MTSFILLLTSFPSWSVWYSDRFDPNDSPPVPNYSDSNYWTVLSEGKEKTADVFYLHPTTFLSDLAWNADARDKKINQETDATYLKWQTSPFAPIAKIYAPHYRQATIYAFIPESDGGPRQQDSQQALDLAYQDIELAFDYYMKNYNQGRPLFLVSHSQGSYLMIRLLQKKYASYHLNKNLVAAYIVGENMGSNSFSNFRPCTNPTQTNCFVTWASVQQGKKPLLVTGVSEGTPICTNPLTFAQTKLSANAKENLGGRSQADFNRVDVGVVSATCDKAILWISPPNKSGYKNEDGDYHESDFNLFALNIQQNAQKRLAQFCTRHPCA